MDAVPKPEEVYLKELVSLASYLDFCYSDFSLKDFMNKLNFIIIHSEVMEHKSEFCNCSIEEIQSKFVNLKTQLDKDKQHIAIQYDEMDINHKFRIIEIMYYDDDDLYDKFINNCIKIQKWWITDILYNPKHPVGIKYQDKKYKKEVLNE